MVTARHLAVFSPGRQMTPRRLSIALFFVALAAGPTSAQENGEEAELEFGATAVVERRIAATNEVDPTAAGTTVSARDRQAAGETTRDLFYEVPSARVIQTGGPGSATAVSLRGAQLSHTSVLLGDLPISGPDSGAFDLSLMPAASLEGIEVYRGGAPVALSDGAIGGVVRLIPRSEAVTGAGAALTLGSFGHYETDAWASVAGEGARSFASVGVRGWQGDFPFVGNTLSFGTDDDTLETRDNAQFLEGHGLLHGRISVGGGELTVVGVGVSQRRGVPGLASAPTPDVDSDVSRGLGSIGYRRGFAGRVPTSVGVSVGGGVERARFRDPYGQHGLSLPRLTDDRLTRLFGRLSVAAEPTEWLELTTVANVRRDSYEPTDALARVASPGYTRVTSSVAFEPRLHGHLGSIPLELRPSVRVAFTRGEVEGTEGAQTPTDGSEVLPTYRLAGVVAPTPWLALSASVASGRRAPSMLELFGNRGVLGPNPDLGPERSLSVDGSAVARGRVGVMSGAVEARVFRLEIDDMISYARQSQGVAIADNLDRARIVGVEAGLRGRATHHLRLTTTVSWLDAQDERGRELPFRPTITAQARPELHSGPLLGVLDDVVLHIGVVHTGRNFFDPVNLERTTPRTWVSAGVRVESFEGALALSFTVTDLADVGGDDLLGYPLPGRRFAGMIGYRLEQW